MRSSWPAWVEGLKLCQRKQELSWHLHPQYCRAAVFSGGLGSVARCARHGLRCAGGWLFWREYGGPDRAVVGTTRSDRDRTYHFRGHVVEAAALILNASCY